MPGFDGTGPSGMGPRTGGGFGFCPPGSGPAPGYYGYRGYFGVGRGGFPWGGGRGRAWGGGRGWAFRSYPYYPYAAYPPPVAAGYSPYYGVGYTAPTSADELNFLKGNLSALEEEMEAVRNRIKELESQEKRE